MNKPETWPELIDHWQARYARVAALNRDLLAVLEFALPFCPVPRGDGSEGAAYIEAYNKAVDTVALARAAIAAAEGEA